LFKNSTVPVENRALPCVPIPEQWSFGGCCVKYLKSYRACPSSSSWTGALATAWVLRTKRPSGR